jgi:hypothetical protein
MGVETCVREESRILLKIFVSKWVEVTADFEKTTKREVF